MHDTNADTNSSSNASADGYSLSLSASSNVNLNLAVSHVDTMTVALGNINVKTTSPGYKLYIGMTGNSTSLAASGTNNAIPATTGSLVAPTSLARGSWGYAIPSNTAHLVSSGFNSTYDTIASNVPDVSKLFAVPPASSSNPQLLAVSTSATTGTGDDYPIYYGVRANSSTPAGTYTNNVLFTALADAGASNTLTLTPNHMAANIATRIEVKTTMYSTAQDADADIYLLTRAQYNNISGTNVEALGVSPLTTCTKTSSTPLTYSCLAPKSTTGDYNIYVKSARYDQVYASTFTVDPLASFFTISSMQQMTYDVCSSVPTPPADGTADEVPTTILADSRDTNSYTIKKLADSRCWMTENLRIGTATATTTLTPSDSNVTSSYTLTKISGSTAIADNKVYDTENASYGAYYNWFTATAGTGTTNLAEDGEQAESSICPKGWHLPSGGEYSEFASLYNQYNSSTKLLGTPNFKKGGYYSNDTIQYQNVNGYYWSNTSKVTDRAYNLNIVTHNGDPKDDSFKQIGFTVRCIADAPDFYEIKIMQQMTANVCSSVPTPSVSDTNVPTTILLDTRDTNSYTVKKLADGRCWMTDNMKLADASIDSTNSNLPPGATFNVPASSEDGWCTDATEACFNKANVLDANNAQHPEYGVYYSWNAATAGYGLYSQMSPFEDVSYSICPKGWRLPSSGNSGDFQTLRNVYSSSAFGNDWRLSPLNFLLSGYRGTSSISTQGVEGFYWSSTVSSNTAGAFGTKISSSAVDINIENGYYVYRGFSVRCIADDFWSITDMQQMTKNMASTLTAPSTTATNEVTTRSAYNNTSNKTTVVPTRTLKDTRDGETYKVRLLADGNIYMVNNLSLEFDGNTTYTSADTDLVAGTTIKPSASQSRNGTTTSAEVTEWVGTGTEQENLNRWLSRSAKTVENGNVVWLSESTAGQTDLTHEGQKYGVYYNTYTALAGSVSFPATVGTKARASICPKGWQLPDDWGQLIMTTYHVVSQNGDQTPDGSGLYPNNILHLSPFSIPYAGAVIDGATQYNVIYLESRTVSNGNTQTETLHIYGNTYTAPKVPRGARLGKSIRCVSR